MKPENIEKGHKLMQDIKKVDKQLETFDDSQLRIDFVVNGQKRFDLVRNADGIELFKKIRTACIHHLTGRKLELEQELNEL